MEKTALTSVGKKSNSVGELVKKLENQHGNALVIAQEDNGNTSIMCSSGQRSGEKLFLASLDDNDQIVISLGTIEIDAKDTIQAIVKDKGDENVDDTFTFNSEDLEELTQDDDESAIFEIYNCIYNYHGEVGDESNVVRVLKNLSEIDSLESIFRNVELMSREERKILFSSKDISILDKFYLKLVKKIYEDNKEE